MMNKMMKKVAMVIAAATMAIAGTTMIASANDGMGYVRTCAINITDTWEVRYVTGVDDFLNIRADVSPKAASIGALYNGQEVIVTGYVECGAVGNYSPFVRVNCNGVEGFVDSSFLGYSQPAQQTSTQTATQAVTPAAQNTAAVDTVVYPRVDRHISNGSISTWCTLNTDGYYYNENGVRYADNGDGTFSDVNGTVYNQI